jgi:hypothetical protein
MPVQQQVPLQWHAKNGGENLHLRRSTRLAARGTQDRKVNLSYGLFSHIFKIILNCKWHLTTTKHFHLYVQLFRILFVQVTELPCYVEEVVVSLVVVGCNYRNYCTSCTGIDLLKIA